jgi:hypothetical protein
MQITSCAAMVNTANFSAHKHSRDPRQQHGQQAKWLTSTRSTSIAKDDESVHQFVRRERSSRGATALFNHLLEGLRGYSSEHNVSGWRTIHIAPLCTDDEERDVSLDRGNFGCLAQENLPN